MCSPAICVECNRPAKDSGISVWLSPAGPVCMGCCFRTRGADMPPMGETALAEPPIAKGKVGEVIELRTHEDFERVFGDVNVDEREPDGAPEHPIDRFNRRMAEANRMFATGAIANMPCPVCRALPNAACVSIGESDGEAVGAAIEKPHHARVQDWLRGGWKRERERH